VSLTPRACRSGTSRRCPWLIETPPHTLSSKPVAYNLDKVAPFVSEIEGATRGSAVSGPVPSHHVVVNIHRSSPVA